MKFRSCIALVLGAVVCWSCGGEQDSSVAPVNAVMPTMDPSGLAVAESPPVVAEPPVEGVDGVAVPPPMNQEPILISAEPAAVNEDPPTEECVSAGVASSTRPVNLFLTLDSSASMGGRNAAQRWNPITIALSAFLSDPASAGLNAALQVFPKPDAFRGNPLRILPRLCNEDTYNAPEVPLQALPGQGDFRTLIDSVVPRGLTPTNPMLQGVISQAESALAADSEARAAIVMLSDGLPTPCVLARGSATERSARTVAAVADRIPTYVIGVGDNLDNLNAIAEAGGTDAALIIDPTEPDATRRQILERLDEIRGAVASCDVTIPEPPVGKQLDPEKVFAKIHRANDTVIDVPYDPDCLSGTGFRYDDDDSPTSIVLCQQACDQLKQRDASVEVVFGCSVNRKVVR